MKGSVRRTNVGFAGMAALALTAQAALAQVPTVGVFSDVQAAVVPYTSSPLDSAAVRRRVVQVDTQKITAARRGREVLTLNLFDDAVVEVAIKRVRPTRSGYFISGTPKGSEWGEVRLVVNGSVIVGTVLTPEGEYTIRSAGSGRHVVRQIDPSALPLECEVVPTATPASSPAQERVNLPAIASVDRLGGSAVPPALASDQPTEDGSEIRVLVVYTPAFQTDQGGSAGARAVIDLMIQTANQAFEDSGINPRLVLAHSAMADYVEQRTTATDVASLLDPDDGYLDEVHALRNQHAADLVHLVTKYVDGALGGTKVPRSQRLVGERDVFGVTADGDEATFTHEIGHNFGLYHDRYHVDPENAVFPYAFGYNNKAAFEPNAPETAGWRTIMTSWRLCVEAGVSCDRLLRFSNPDQSYNGDPLGVPADDPTRGRDGPADARLTVNNMARWVGSFRSEACTEFDLSVESIVLPIEGGKIDGAVAVETSIGCLWEASSTADFFSVTSPERSAGSGIVHIKAEANETGADRTGILSVAGKEITVRQIATEQGICGRTPAVLNAITESIGKNPEDCDEIAAEDLATISRLSITNKGLRTLKAGDFDGLSGLDQLSLRRNEIKALPKGLFAGLSNLRVLSVSVDAGKTLPAGLFEGLSGLEQLDLCCGELTALPDGAFDGLSNLHWLVLNHNEFAKLPPEIFAGLTKLQHLNLEANQISNVPPEVFANLANLENLRLTFNPFTRLPDGVFKGLTNLKRLDLSGNELTVVPDQLLEGLVNLETFLLRWNPLTSVPENLFAGQSNLLSLDLSGNELTSLPEGLLGGLSHLKELRLEHNRFAELPAGTFAGLSNLESLIMFSSRLPEIRSGLFAGLSRVKTLNLYANHIADVPADAFSDLKALEDLDLGLNAISSLPDGVFSGLSSLETLSLYANPLRELPSGTFSELAALRTLNMNRMELLGLPEGVFAGLTQVETVDLERNRISALPLTVSLEKSAEGQVKAVAPAGLPFELTVPLHTSSGGVLEGDADSVVIPAGATESEFLVASRADDTEEAVTVDIGTLPGIPGKHRGYTLEKDDALPILVLPSLSGTDAALGGLSLSAGELEPAFSADEYSYTALVANDATSVTVTPSTRNTSASVAFLDASDGMLADADAGEVGQQVTLEEGENTIKVRVASQDGSTTQAYTLVVTRDASANVCLRTPQVRDAILAASGAGSCSEVTQTDLAGIRELDLADAGIFSFQPGDFRGLAAVEKIELWNNDFSALPADLFADLSALKELDLQGNFLTELPADVFSDLGALERLRISSNRFRSLPPDIFAGLTRLNSFQLGGNRYRRLPDGLFESLTSLKDLDLGGCTLNTVPPDLFANLPALERLDLGGNNLRSLPGSVSELTTLKELDLSGNQLSTLPEGSFSSMARLEILELDDNWFRSLPDGLFLGLPALKELSLDGNSVHPLPLAVSLEKVTAGQFKAVAPSGVPFDLEVSVSISDTGTFAGNLDSVSISAGTVASSPLEVMRVAGTEEAVTVDISSLPALPEDHEGYFLAKDESLPRQILPGPNDTAPAQVTGVELTPDAESLDVSWTAVSDATGYKVQWKSGDEDYADARQGVVSGGETITYTIAGLTTGTEYTVQVIATGTGMEDGAPSSEVTGTPKAAAPSQVTGVAISAGEDEITVTWTAVSDATGYKVQWKSGNEDYADAREGLATEGDTTTYAITGLAADTEYTIRVIATKDNAEDGPPSEEVTATPVSAGPDVNGDGILDGNDAQLMYQAYASVERVGDGESGGTAESRRTLLSGLAATANPSDGDLKAMLRKAHVWKVVGLAHGGDINEDGVIDGDDTFVMYYAYEFADLVGDGETGGTARHRQHLLASRSNKDDPTDEDLKAMLRRANKLKEKFG